MIRKKKQLISSIWRMNYDCIDDLESGDVFVVISFSDGRRNEDQEFCILTLNGIVKFKIPNYSLTFFATRLQ